MIKEVPNGLIDIPIYNSNSENIRIRNDVSEAINRGISLFEFEGDYDLDKMGTERIRTAVRPLVRNYAELAEQKVREKIFAEFGTCHYYDPYRFINHFCKMLIIKSYSYKDGGKRRRFCKIDPTIFDKMEDIYLEYWRTEEKLYHVGDN